MVRDIEKTPESTDEGHGQVLVQIAMMKADRVAERYALLKWDRLRPYTCSMRMFGARESRP